jgi:hypothetical protein
MAQDRDQWRALVNTVMNLLLPENYWKFLNGCTTGGSSRRAQLRKSCMGCRIYIETTTYCSDIQASIVVICYTDGLTAGWR